MGKDMTDKIHCNKVQGDAPRQGKHAFPIPHDTQLRTDYPRGNISRERFGSLCGQGPIFQTSYTTRDCQRKQAPWIN